MKRIILSVLLLAGIMSLMAVEIVMGEQKEGFCDPVPAMKDLQKVVTEKEKDGKMIQREWLGVYVSEISEKFSVNGDYTLVFRSADNYLVRLKSEEIAKYNPMLAFYLNGEKLEENNRLVIKDMPAMYWSRKIVSVEVKLAERTARPTMVYLAEQALKDIEITSNPEPFKDVKGYYFPQLLMAGYAELGGEYLLVGKDGIKHKLDYENYLKKAVLVITESGYMLQSPQMPGGMWLKDIAYIQKGDTAMMFTAQLADLETAAKLLEWKVIPKSVELSTVSGDSKSISVEENFSSSVWEKGYKFNW